MNLAVRYFKDFVSLLFPKLCHACRSALTLQEELLCISCIHNLPCTNYHTQPNNQLEKVFWGRVQIEAASSYLFFNQGGIVQNIMHQLKYNNIPHLGVLLGEMYGKQLKNKDHYKTIDGIIPVPLHPKKHHIRGYNQSEQIAIGLGKSLNIPVYTQILKRIKYAESQVNKDRKARYESLYNSFIADGDIEKLNRIILLDDTITTGATLEACILALNKAGIYKITVLGIAYAM